MPPFIPYCGHAPVPGALADPHLLAALVIFLVLALIVGEARGRTSLFMIGWAMLSLAFVSPLCNLSVALFSARVGQHMALDFVAAPLLVAGLAPVFDLQPKAPNNLALAAASLVFAAVLWFWHMPAPYDATLTNNLIYWGMHLSSLFAAIWLWRAIFSARGFVAFLAVTFTGLQMSALGAFLTFSRFPLFVVHKDTTWPWGLSPLADQQLGGLLMWIPAGLLITLYSVIALSRNLDETRKTTAAWSVQGDGQCA
ncbi:cytochrome c oxidase assembly protein [Rhodoblastus sp.]|uniref:cytochrome c oxidase assembly protein n=1 Tax=Rhodoblastus sp. TaxID=1962975 RepID=UPI003F9652A3